jgi:hypothetical protein
VSSTALKVLQGGLTTTDMTLDEARAVTDRIKVTTEELWSLLLAAYEGKAWRALGYSDWAAYVAGEFGMSRRHSYRLLDQGVVIRELAAASGQSVTHGSQITERAAREIKPDLPRITDEIRERVEAGEEPEAAVRQVVEENREERRAHRRPAEALPEPEPEPDEGGFDATAELHAALEDIQRLVAEIESHRSTDHGREIARLHEVVAGQSSRIATLTTQYGAAEQQARRQGKVLREIRTLLGVESDRDIVPQLRELVA